MTWTTAAYDFVAQKWADGRSASEISRGLKATLHMDKTRNAVIGVIHRRNLPKRVLQNPTGIEQSARATRIRVRRERKVRQAPKAERYEPPPILPPLEPRRTLLTLGAMECKFPVGDPKDADFTYCARPVLGAFCYCEAHRALAYTPRTKRQVDSTKRLARYLDGLSVRRL